MNQDSDKTGDRLNAEMALGKVLVVDDDPVLRESVKESLQFHNFVVDEASNGKLALSAVQREKYDLLVMDVNMPEMDGLETLKQVKAYDPSIIILILTAYSNVRDAVLAVKEGAYNYLEKPISSENLVALIKRALKARSLVETSAWSLSFSLGKEESEERFVGQSDAMKKVFHVISKLSEVKTPVLIRGESGTGKELVARAIHYNGPRKDEKFVTVNLAAVPENLIESELFGHEKGAFTGASERKIGKFQYADEGTLFLDEIGDISPAMQVKLLRVLQDQKFSPIGSNREVQVDVRIIAASHKNFEHMIRDGSFREDLFYRLNVLPVFLPPLRHRKEDIAHLLDYYIKYFNRRHGIDIKGPTQETAELIKMYTWPGNIRELRNVIEHAFILESSEYLRPESLPSFVQNQKLLLSRSDDENDSSKVTIDLQNIRDSILDRNSEIGPPEKHHNSPSRVERCEGESPENLDFQYAKDSFERNFIIMALKSHRGRINRTALKANIPKKTLLRKIEKYSINPKDFY